MSWSPARDENTPPDSTPIKSYMQRRTTPSSQLMFNTPVIQRQNSDNFASSSKPDFRNSYNSWTQGPSQPSQSAASASTAQRQQQLLDDADKLLLDVARNYSASSKKEIDDPATPERAGDPFDRYLQGLGSKPRPAPRQPPAKVILPLPTRQRKKRSTNNSEVTMKDHEDDEDTESESEDGGLAAYEETMQNTPVGPGEVKQGWPQAPSSMSSGKGKGTTTTFHDEEDTPASRTLKAALEAQRAKRDAFITPPRGFMRTKTVEMRRSPVLESTVQEPTTNQEPDFEMGATSPPPAARPHTFTTPTRPIAITRTVATISHDRRSPVGRPEQQTEVEMRVVSLTPISPRTLTTDTTMNGIPNTQPVETASTLVESAVKVRGEQWRGSHQTSFIPFPSFASNALHVPLMLPTSSASPDTVVEQEQKPEEDCQPPNNCNAAIPGAALAAMRHFPVQSVQSSLIYNPSPALLESTYLPQVAFQPFRLPDIANPIEANAIPGLPVAAPTIGDQSRPSLATMASREKKAPGLQWRRSATQGWRRYKEPRIRPQPTHRERQRQIKLRKEAEARVQRLTWEEPIKPKRIINWDMDRLLQLRLSEQPCNAKAKKRARSPLKRPLETVPDEEDDEERLRVIRRRCEPVEAPSTETESSTDGKEEAEVFEEKEQRQRWLPSLRRIDITLAPRTKQIIKVGLWYGMVFSYFYTR